MLAGGKRRCSCINIGCGVDGFNSSSVRLIGCRGDAVRSGGEQCCSRCGVIGLIVKVTVARVARGFELGSSGGLLGKGDCCIAHRGVSHIDRGLCQGGFCQQHGIVRVGFESLVDVAKFNGRHLSSYSNILISLRGVARSTITDDRVQTATHDTANHCANGASLVGRIEVEVFTAASLFNQLLAKLLTVLLTCFGSNCAACATNRRAVECGANSIVSRACNTTSGGGANVTRGDHVGNDAQCKSRRAGISVAAGALVNVRGHRQTFARAAGHC